MLYTTFNHKCLDCSPVEAATNAEKLAAASNTTAAEQKIAEEAFKVEWEALIRTEKEEVQQSWTHRILAYVRWSLLLFLIKAAPFIIFKVRKYVRANKVKLLVKRPAFILNDPDDIREMIRTARLERHFRWRQPTNTSPIDKRRI